MNTTECALDKVNQILSLQPEPKKQIEPSNYYLVHKAANQYAYTFF